jgi:hypothetical protein
MRIVVSDSSCLIDLRKASLLEAFLALPYEILIPNTLFEEELLKFTVEEKVLLRDRLKVMDLPGEAVLRAQQIIRALPHLSVHDGFAFALAEMHQGCILLTGDGSLRALGEGKGFEVHGGLVGDRRNTQQCAGRCKRPACGLACVFRRPDCQATS